MKKKKVNVEDTVCGIVVILVLAFVLYIAYGYSSVFFGFLNR